MNLQIVGCSHHLSSVAVRERLAFSQEQAKRFLDTFYERYPNSEAVLLATCNRTEFYMASEESNGGPSSSEMIELLASSRNCEAKELASDLFKLRDREAVAHLFSVAASLDSMVIGEGQILGQVKDAYQLATEANSQIPMTHRVFQAAIRVAKRVANETEVHANRTSVPSVAIGLFARQIFERLDNKRCLVLGAGEMAEETLNYLVTFGGRDIVVCNRTRQNALDLAKKFEGRVADWSEMQIQLTQADLVVSTTGSSEPILMADQFRLISKERQQKPLFILDLAIPRDIDPDIGEELNVYLFTIDDLQKECDRNRTARMNEWPKAEKIIDMETTRFLREMSHRSGSETISQLKKQANVVKAAELQRLMNRLQGLSDEQKSEIEYAFHRVVNKILHPPLEALKAESLKGNSKGLLDALKRLFQLGD